MKFRFALFLFCLPVCLSAAFAQPVKTYMINSPDGKTAIRVSAGSTVTWSADHEGAAVVAPSEISLSLAGGEVLGKNVKVSSIRSSSVNSVISTPIYKKNKVSDHYNQLIISFKKGFGLIFRAYNDGAAYRFFTTRKEQLTIINEEANFNFAGDVKATVPFVNDYRNNDRFNTSFEAYYDTLHISEIKKDTLAFLPLMADLGNSMKAVILEADLQDYPGMYLSPNTSGGFHGVFAGYPTEEFLKGINYAVKSRADYIAKTNGTRSFPWRVVVISTDDRQLADNDMTQRLAEASRISDPSWIKPGKVAWDWWNNWNITHVGFKSGINVPTYKYYIDFAAANGLPYIIIDEGWSDDGDLNSTKLDVQQIVDYGKQKQVGVILWSTWYGITRDADGLFKKYAGMGIKGFKIDFIDRDDQKMVSSLYNLAGTAAKYHLMVDYHGMYKPSGLLRTWPNVINCEGVKGLENMKWITVARQPDYDVTLPFIRMMAGPMDYTPGAMRNAPKDAFRPVNSNPMSQGTRCHQLAMYTIFEAPLQMLADNPTAYQKEQESTNFIDAIPTTFNNTVALDGKVGEYISIARQKGDTWYVGAMTGWTPKTLKIDLSFLGKGTYRAVIFEDGINAGKDGTDYVTKTMNVTAGDQLTAAMAAGGGWTARFVKVE